MSLNYEAPVVLRIRHLSPNLMENGDYNPTMDSMNSLKSKRQNLEESQSPSGAKRPRRRVAPETEEFSEKSQRKIVRNPKNQPRLRIFTPGQLDCLQAQEAQTHQFEVDHGLCWKQIYPIELLPPTSNIYSNELEGIFPEIIWTGEQKAQFFELIGRRGKSALPEIAQIVGKSVVDCQRYLCLLDAQSESMGCQIDRADIPAAEEVPTEYLERDLPVAVADPNAYREVMIEQQVSALRAKGSSYGELIYVPKVLHKLFKLPPDPNVYKILDSIMREVLKRWLREIIELRPSKSTTIKVSGNQLRALMVRNFSQFVGFSPHMLKYFYDEEEDLKEQEKKALTKAKKIATRKATMAAKRAATNETLPSTTNDDENGKGDTSNVDEEEEEEADEANIEEEMSKGIKMQDSELKNVAEEKKDLIEDEEEEESSFDDELFAEWESEQTNQSFDSSSSDENEDLMQLVDDIPDESQLCEDEADWLEWFDNFQSEIFLQMRGIEQELQVDPPPSRSEQLMHFMCS